MVGAGSKAYSCLLSSADNCASSISAGDPAVLQGLIGVPEGNALDRIVGARYHILNRVVHRFQNVLIKKISGGLPLTLPPHPFIMAYTLDNNWDYTLDCKHTVYMDYKLERTHMDCKPSQDYKDGNCLTLSR